METSAEQGPTDQMGSQTAGEATPAVPGENASSNQDVDRDKRNPERQDQQKVPKHFTWRGSHQRIVPKGNL